MLRSSVARIVSSVIGISYVLPVRLSVTVRVSLDVATSPSFPDCRVSVVIALLSHDCRGLQPAPGSSGRPSHPLYYPRNARSAPAAPDPALQEVRIAAPIATTIS